MANRPLNTVVRHIRRIAGELPNASESDRSLLARFIAERDEDSFTALVQRHGPMVRGVCGRVLGQSADVDDAFQATFLLLVRKAHSIRKADSVASWLYGVAYRVARRLKSCASRPQVLERRRERAADDPGLEVAWRELCVVLDQEVNGLAEKYRAALVLCYLEGQTRDQAARQLGWSLRTLDRRLTEGREYLRRRLVRRGLTLSAGLLAAALAEHASAAVPVKLLNSTLKAATLLAGGELLAAAASGPVAGLVSEGIRAMVWTKLHTVTIVTILAAGITGGGVLVMAGGAPGQEKGAEQATAIEPGAEPVGVVRDDDERDPRVAQPMRGGSDRSQLARERMQSQNNLKQLALAMHNYEATYNHFPAPAIYGGQARGGRAGGGAAVGGGSSTSSTSGSGPTSSTTGSSGGSSASGVSGSGGGPASGGAGLFDTFQPGSAGGKSFGGGMARGSKAGGSSGRRSTARALLSWRVALLPYLEEDALYKEFRLNEPWDSTHNKKLLARMPKIFAPIGGAARDNPTSTFYQVFVGPRAAFEKHTQVRIADIIDGTANTIMIAEAGHAVPWTKPEDLPFAQDEPLPELGGLFKEGFNVALCDGSVRMIPRSIDETTLRAAITRDGSEAINLDRLSTPSANMGGAPRRTDRAGAQQENLHLREEYQLLLSLRDQLKNEVTTAQQGDKEAQRLREENARLSEQIQRIRDEVRALQDQLRQLKQPSSEPRKRE